MMHRVKICNCNLYVMPIIEMGYARVWFAGRPADRRHFCNALCHALPPDIRSTQMTQDEFSAVIELRPGLL